jgi:hypothetical protein
MAIAKDSNGFPVVVSADATVGDTKLNAVDDAIVDLHVTGGKKTCETLADTTFKKNMVKDYTLQERRLEGLQVVPAHRWRGPGRHVRQQLHHVREHRVRADNRRTNRRALP